MKTKLFSLILVFALLFSIGVTAHAAEYVPEALLTVDEYIEFLEKESPEDLLKFKALDQDEQIRFVSYLTNPDTYNGTLNTSEIKRSTTYDCIENYTSGSNMGIMRAVTWDAWGTSTVTILGIEVLEYRIEVGYNVSGSTITGINYNEAFVVKNLNPLVQTDTTGKSAYISNNVVHAKGTFNYKLGPLKGLSVQIGNIYGELLAYSNGNTSISYWRD